VGALVVMLSLLWQWHSDSTGSARAAVATADVMVVEVRQTATEDLMVVVWRRRSMAQ
jgi:hypothetical protein